MDNLGSPAQPQQHQRRHDEGGTHVTLSTPLLIIVAVLVAMSIVFCCVRMRQQRTVRKEFLGATEFKEHYDEEESFIHQRSVPPPAVNRKRLDRTSSERGATQRKPKDIVQAVVRQDASSRA